MLWLLVFLAVAVVVQARQSTAIAAAARLATLREERAALEAQQAALRREIHSATTRQTLGRRAEALGLHQPGDSEFVILPLGAGRRP